MWFKGRHRFLAREVVVEGRALAWRLYMTTLIWKALPFRVCSTSCCRDVVTSNLESRSQACPGPGYPGPGYTRDCARDLGTPGTRACWVDSSLVKYG